MGDESGLLYHNDKTSCASREFRPMDVLESSSGLHDAIPRSPTPSPLAYKQQATGRFTTRRGQRVLAEMRSGSNPSMISSVYLHHHSKTQTHRSHSETRDSWDRPTGERGNSHHRSRTSATTETSKLTCGQASRYTGRNAERTVSRVTSARSSGLSRNGPTSSAIFSKSNATILSAMTCRQFSADTCGPLHPV